MTCAVQGTWPSTMKFIHTGDPCLQNCLGVSHTPILKFRGADVWLYSRGLSTLGTKLDEVK
jgi:hypothetical protein